MAAALAVWLTAPVVAGNDAAQAIAQKFSEADKTKAAGKPEPVETVNRTEQPKSGVQPKSGERPSLDYEMDMLRRARIEEQERQQQGATVKPAPAEAREEPSVAQATPAAKPPAAAPEPSPAPTVTTAKATESPQTPPTAAPVTPPVTLPSGGQHVTFLLSLATDANAIAHPDPILCLGETCWLSNGLESAAKPVQRSTARALKSTANASDDSCAGKSACVYRNVVVPDDAIIEVIEIGVGDDPADDRYAIDIDKSCRLDEGDLVCDNALETRDYRLWAVPETTAISAGAGALEDAIDDDLEGGAIQSANDK